MPRTKLGGNEEKLEARVTTDREVQEASGGHIVMHDKK